MTDVDDFILRHEGNQRDLMYFIHNYMMAQPQMTTKLRYKIPFYYRKTWICYLNPRKDNSIEFCFIRGRELSNEQGILDAKGRKMITSINLSKFEDIPQEALFEVIHEALLLDETVPFSVKKKNK